MQEADAEFGEIMMALGRRIKEIRLKANLTQEQMDAEPFPIEFRNYQRIEAGEQNITLKTLYKLSKKLRCDMRAFWI